MLHRVSLYKMVEEGYELPRLYAPCFREYPFDVLVCAPVGLHLVIRWARDLWFWILRVGYPGYRERIERLAYSRALDSIEKHDAT